MMQYFYEGNSENSIPINIVFRSDYKKWLGEQSEFIQNWIQSSRFEAKANHHLCIPNSQGNLDSVLAISDQENTTWTLGKCPGALPEGDYHISMQADNTNMDAYLIGWGMGAYSFEKYKNVKNKNCKLSMDNAGDKDRIIALLNATKLVRDMVNTPASDMQPQHIHKQCESIAEQFQVELSACIGDELLNENYPVIHAVGRASVHSPRLIQWKWGNTIHPKVALVGKGVSFDSGGLDIKSSQGMRLMKKDMGGAAHVLGVASAIMELNLPIRLHVLIPAVENAVSGNAYRPGDILKSRSDKTIEIDNTDAEGRLILCDAISRAIEDSPEILIDFATLTGAARIALGTEVPAFFTNDESVAEGLMAAAHSVDDPIWQLPLYKPYRHMLNSNIADITNCASSGFGGAITAALFLQEFVPETTRWVHFDVMAWNSRERPGRPKGGEAMGLRAVVDYLQNYYS